MRPAEAAAAALCSASCVLHFAEKMGACNSLHCAPATALAGTCRANCPPRPPGQTGLTHTSLQSRVPSAGGVRSGPPLLHCSGRLALLTAPLEAAAAVGADSTAVVRPLVSACVLLACCSLSQPSDLRAHMFQCIRSPLSTKASTCAAKYGSTCKLLNRAAQTCIRSEARLQACKRPMSRPKYPQWLHATRQTDSGG